MHRRFPLTLFAAVLTLSSSAFAQNELDRANATARPPIAPPLPNFQAARSDEDGPFSRETPATYVAKKTKGAVVMLRAMQSIPARLNTDEAGRTTNLGAGIIFDKRGYIVTNYHVVANVQKIDASWPDGRVRTARRVNFDAKADLAVLKLDGDGDYPIVSLSEGVPAIEGEVAIAVGNPYGLGNSLAWGIVSHVGRDMKLPNNEMGRDLIQVSAAINPGNSGGPLFNVNGQLLGITAAIRSNSQGIAFAITTKRVLDVVKNLMPSPISLDTLGLAVTELSSPSSQLSPKTLVEVSHVDAGSPASKAGLARGDRIDAVDDQIVRSSFDLERAFWNRRFGDSLKLKINGKPTVVDMRILNAAGKQLTHAELVWSRLGIWALEVPASRVKHINPDYKGGLLVVNVAAGSYAEKAGLLPGDIILGVLANGDGFSTVEAANFTYMMREEQKLNIKDGYVDVLYMRDGELAPQAKMFLPADR